MVTPLRGGGTSPEFATALDALHGRAAAVPLTGTVDGSSNGPANGPPHRTPATDPEQFDGLVGVLAAQDPVEHRRGLRLDGVRHRGTVTETPRTGAST